MSRRRIHVFSRHNFCIRIAQITGEEMMNKKLSSVDSAAEPSVALEVNDSMNYS